MAKHIPIIIYTNLFTLSNRNVKDNKYIDMFYVWLFNIIKNGKLTMSDYCIIFIDNVTIEYIRKSCIYTFLIQYIQNFKIIEYNQPNTIKDGILQRYNIKNIINITYNVEYLNPYYIHLDIDVLVINDIRKLFVNNYENHNNTTIYLRKEGKLLDSNYYGDIITTDEKQILDRSGMLYMPGFSAGIYAWRNSKDIKEYFEFVLNMAKKTTKELYTVEQPFFNGAVFNYFFKKRGIFNFVILDDICVGHNRFSNQVSSNTILLNFCGIPGDESFHWDKILMELFISIL